jgi:hypothetical protein
MQNMPPARALTTMRIIWGTLIFSQLLVLFLVVAHVIPVPPNAKPMPFLPLVDWIMLLTLVPGAYAFRQMAFRRFQINGKIPAPAYGTANLVFWAACEGVAFAGIVFGMVTGNIVPTLPVIVIALALQLLTFPKASMLHIP